MGDAGRRVFSVKHIPLIAITGPTASGKTALAVELALKYDGEIICADSRTIYKYMDIGTAKPSIAERNAVPHWGIDIVSPDETFSVAQFKEYADAAIANIRERGKVPFLVGGTGLYVDSVVFNYQFGAPSDESLRTEFEAMTIGELHKYCEKLNIPLPENKFNKRYVIRTIEKNDGGSSGDKERNAYGYIVGIATKKDILKKRITQRAEQLFENGVVDEAIMLGKKYGWDSEAMTGNIYALVEKYIAGSLSQKELEQQFITSDVRLAKRQMTWMRRNEHLLWCDIDTANTYITQILAATRYS